jgi:photosystem II stability/assembly factor-like uncharacterized protein
VNKKHALVTVCVLIFVFQACSSPSPAPISVTTRIATLPATTTSTPTPTAMPTVTPTPIPLAWTQISDGQEFERDTVTAFATDKNDPNVIYAAMKNSGVYKTIDGGLSWQPAHHGLVSMQVESLLIDSQNPLILYASTMGGVFKTEDGGENWSRVGDGTYLLMDMQDNSHLYARDENSIYETTDQGNTWNTMYALKQDCPDAINSWAIHPADGNMLFIGGGEECKPGTYQSIDSGRSWMLTGMEGKTSIDTLIIGLDEQGNFSIYASIYAIYAQHGSLLGGEIHGVYTSHDGGSSWSKSEGAFGCNILAFDTDNPGVIYCGGTSPISLLITKGKGSPWKAIPGSYSKVYTAIHIDHPKGISRIIAGGTDVSTTSDPNVGIFMTEDGGISWIQRDNGLGFTRAELKIDPLDSARIYVATYFPSANGAGCRLYRSLDNGKNWPLIQWRSGQWCGPTFDTAHVLYMNQGGKLQKSWDGGVTWLWDSQDPSYRQRPYIDPTIAFALPSFSKGSSQSVSANPYIEGFIYDVGDVIYYSTDSGVSWQPSAGSEGSWDARLYYTDQSKMTYAIGRYHQKYSTDSGKTWQACGEDVTTSRSDSRLALDLQGSLLYLATSGNGVMVSTDKCQSWQASNNGLGNLFVNTVAIDPNNSDIVYAGTDGGAYVSFDGGGTWGQVNNGLIGSNIVYSIAVDKDSNVYAATPYGVFTLEGK